MSTKDAIITRAATFLEPIAGAEPAGQNAAYDPRFEAVRSELAKLDNPAGGEVEWKQVARGCQELLTAVTKDFLLASHHALALVQLERWQGLATGLAVLDGMFERYWDAGFPPVARLRARGNALDWLVARLEITLPTLGVQADEVAMFELVRGQWSSLASRARERLGEHAPGMGGVGDVLERLRINLPADALAAAATATPASAAPAAEAAASAEPAAPIEPAAAANPATTASPPPPDDPLAEATAKAAAWLEPIPGANPAGEEARYDATFESARLEVAKLEAITDNVVDWKLVHEHASSILRDKSKDLLMATYLAFAKLKLSGLDGLIVGMLVINGMLERYWEGMHPERLRGRANAMAWLLTQLEPALGTLSLQAKDRPLVLQFQAATARASTLLRERMGAEGPSFGPIVERVQRMLLALPEDKPAAPPPPPPPPTPAAEPTAAAPAAAPAMPTVAAASSPEAVGTFLQETGRALVSAANLLRESNRANPTAYRLLRVGLYLHLENPPPAEAGGKTQIPPLAPARRSQFATLEQNGKWEALLDEAESALGQSRFCLDLHRLSHRALDRLGDAFAPARQVIVGELAALLSRMPTLPELSARDGSPLCDADTKTWLAQVVLAGSGTAVVTAGGAGDDDDGKVFAEVRGLITGGKASDGLRMAQARIDAATTARQRFTRQLALAGALLDGGQAMLARGLFAALERELREHELFAWEPQLAGRCLEGFVRAIRAAAKAGARYEQADAVFERLCAVDPTAAARLAT